MPLILGNRKAALVLVKHTVVARTHLMSGLWKFRELCKQLEKLFIPLTSTWPHLRCDVGLEEGEYK